MHYLDFQANVFLPEGCYERPGAVDFPWLLLAGMTSGYFHGKQKEVGPHSGSISCLLITYPRLLEILATLPVSPCVLSKTGNLCLPLYISSTLMGFFGLVNY